MGPEFKQTLEFYNKLTYVCVVVNGYHCLHTPEPAGFSNV